MASSSFLLFLILGSLCFFIVEAGRSERVLTENDERHLFLEPKVPLQHKKRSSYLSPLPELQDFKRPTTDVDTPNSKQCTYRAPKKVTLHKRQAKCTWGFRLDFPCENPETRARYAATVAAGYAKPIILRYNLVILHADDGSDPTATDDQIQLQHAVLNDAFKSSNIQFTYTIQRIKSSALRYKIVLRDSCTRQQVTDNVTTPGCVSAFTGWDNGRALCSNSNCDPSCTSYDDLLDRPNACPCICARDVFSCSSSNVGNGFCNPECNYAKFNYDGGDCCPAAGSSNSAINKNFTCREPSNSLRNWIDADDFYFFLNLDSTSHINVVVGNGDDNTISGWGVGPNSDSFFTSSGGIFLNSRLHGFGVYLSEGKIGLSFVHMMGHVLGLLDVHAGTHDLELTENSKQAACRHPCYEEQPLLSQEGSSTTGDLINDTRPTPYNTLCRDPFPCSPGGNSFCSDCQDGPWLSTPYNNYMAASGDSCPKIFTRQQVGRMYCYADQFLRPYWQGATSAPTSPPPTPEKYSPVASESQNAILVDWSGVLPNYFGADTKLVASDFTWLVMREPAFVHPVQVTGSSYQDINVLPHTAYRYRVQLILDSGILGAWSPWSNVVNLAKLCTCRHYSLSAIIQADRLRSCEVCGKSRYHGVSTPTPAPAPAPASNNPTPAPTSSSAPSPIVGNSPNEAAIYG